MKKMFTPIITMAITHTMMLQILLKHIHTHQHWSTLLATATELRVNLHGIFELAHHVSIGRGMQQR